MTRPKKKAAPASGGTEGALTPQYGAGGLAGVMPAVARSLGVPGMHGDLVELPQAQRAVLVLVDGLGDALLRRRSGHAPFLRGLLDGGHSLRAGFPSTTATSLASLGTGLPPGAHGLVGYEAWNPEVRGIFNELSWEGGPDPRTWQPFDTVFERSAATVEPTSIGPAHFRGSGLTVAALRGPRFSAADQWEDRMEAALAALAAPRALVYLYWGEVDKVGHEYGCESVQWVAELERIDAGIAELSRRVPPGTAIHVTADHGMIDTDNETRIDMGAIPALQTGVEAVVGDARAPHVHTRAGAEADVLSAWREVLGERAWVASREEAIEAGVFGPVDPRVAPRVGDVVVAMRDRWVVLDSRRHSASMLSLIGHHGAMTPDELAIPLLTVAPR